MEEAIAPENIGYDKLAAADRNRHDCSFAAHFRADDRKFTYNLREVHSEPTFNKSFNRIRVADTGGWWWIVIDYGLKSARFRLGEGERGAIPTSASKLLEFSSL